MQGAPTHFRDLAVPARSLPPEINSCHVRCGRLPARSRRTRLEVPHGVAFGQIALGFADTTEGRIRFHDWIGDAAWAKDIHETQGYLPNYPMIGDTDFTASKLCRLQGDPVPEGHARQLVYPFARQDDGGALTDLTER